MGEWIKSLLVRFFKFDLYLINKKTNPLIITGNITTKKVAEDSAALNEIDMKRDKRAKFIELGEKRVANAIRALRLVGNLADRNNYQYSEKDAADISKALRIEVTDVVNKFKSSDSGKTTSIFKFTDS